MFVILRSEFTGQSDAADQSGRSELKLLKS
jgi:hypothetical protein